MRFDVVIVGGGHAGAQAAIALRQAAFGGSIAIVGDEAVLPYERPPLSKEYATGDRPAERLLIRPAAFWAQRAITLLLGRTVVTVEPDQQTITTDDGTTIAYGTLIWAAGGSARRLQCAGHDLGGVHTLRTLADADRMIAELPTTARAVVIGGGYIGLEAAALLRKAGKAVTLVEALDRVLTRVAGTVLSTAFADVHRAHGVDVLLGTAVDRIEGDTRVTGVRLTDGTLLPAELVIVGIGIVPAVAPLLVAGARGGDGVAVDAQGRTSLRNVFAVGDCALHRNRYAGDRPIRLESVQNAVDQATVAAKVIAGQDASYDAVPWFWSNQYDLKLQTVGLSAGHDATVTRGDVTTRSFSVVYLRDGGVIALDCVNAVRDYVQGRKLVVERTRIDPARLADPAVPLKDMEGLAP